MNDKKVRNHISHSQCEMMLRCGAQYYYRYIKGEKIPPSGPLFLGITFDEGLSEQYKQKVNSEKDLSVPDVKDIFVDKFDKGKDTVDWHGDKPEDFREPGIFLVGEHMEENAPKIMPKTVQDKIEVKPEGFNYTIMTVTDLTTRSGDIIDIKTTGKSPSKNKETGEYIMTDSHLRQGAIYNYTYRVKHGIDAFGFETLNHVRKKNPVIIPVRTIITPQIESFAFQQIVRVRSMIDVCKASDIWVPNRGHMMCSRKQCG